MDPADYKYLVLGLIFLKFVSDNFLEQQQRILEMVSDPESEYYLSEKSDHQEALEERDYYTQANVFWVPHTARWESIRNQAKQPEIGQIIDQSLIAIENENPRLKGILDKRFGLAQLEPGRMGELIDLISTIGFSEGQKAGDVLGDVYEYFLGEFASSEGKRRGQFYTPSSIVKTLVEVLSPHQGRVYDPCCGSGGMFVQSERFVKSHGGKRDDISIYGQESNPTTWKLAHMNVAIRGFAADLGKEHADTFARDQHIDQKFDYILANPPFNISDWGGEKYDGDIRWKFGRPSPGNANYAWLQHILWKLSPDGKAGVVLANGSLSSDQNNEGEIRREMVLREVVEVVLALPSQLFGRNFQGPVCIWFLTNNKSNIEGNIKGETLFVDATKMGEMISRVERVLSDEEIAKIADTVCSWRYGKEYKNIAGFCYKAKVEEIEKNSFVLTPGRYVGAPEEDDDGEPFDKKMKRLTSLLIEQQEEGTKLDRQITENLKRIGYE